MDSRTCKTCAHWKGRTDTNKCRIKPDIIPEWSNPECADYKLAFIAGTQVKWVDGVGFEHTGIIACDTTDFMVSVRAKDDSILRIRYLDLHICS